MYYCKPVITPVGELTLIASDRGLAAILWQDEVRRHPRLSPRERDDNHPVLRETETQLREYFAGTRRVFDLPLDMDGTAFQKKSGRRYFLFRLAKPAVTARSPSRLGIRQRYVPSVLLTAEIRCPLWHRVIGSLGPMEN